MPSAIVTGGAGFIGSHLVKRLLDDGYQVKVIDNFSGGRRKNLEPHTGPDLVISETNLDVYSEAIEAVNGAEVVFHLAADPDVKSSGVDPGCHYRNNVEATFNVLEAMRLHGMGLLVFASSSVVYGDAKVMPTPEDYSLNPISIYGATKLACEALITGYVTSFGLKALFLRPANIIGGNATHGVILDFINKLRANPRELEILGDGTQRKSYLHVSDFVNAVMQGYQHFEQDTIGLEILNVGNHDSTDVMEIARAVADEMDLGNVNFRLVQELSEGRAWVGDVKANLLAISKLTDIGWQPSLSSNEAVKQTCRELYVEMSGSV